MSIEVKDLVKAAREFAKSKNRGLSSRIRERLDEMKPALTILVNERVIISDIQEFIRANTGWKIGITMLKQYLRETFNYPPTKSGKGEDGAQGN